MKKYILLMCCKGCKDLRSENFVNKGIRIFLIPVLLLLVALSPPLYAGETETVESLVDENRVLTSPLELHLTSSQSPLINSTVSLNHQDGWLFFDNIKPSVVIATYASSILINGAKLAPGGNGRVSVYGNGTVIIPHASSFLPLTVYSEDNFGGNSQQLSIHYYYNNLGEFDNAIKSFKLKRGYMATLANNSDGSGYSRVFIADNEDLEFSILPEELYGSVSFIRVFRHQWVNKKGKAGWNPHDINATSYYDWNIGGSSSTDVEYVAIRQNAGWPSWSSINGKQDVSHLLGFNEPDRPDQANMTFEQMIDIWPAMMESGLRIGSPAWSNAWGGNGGNLFDFINTCDQLNYRIDFVALHCYWGGKSPINWYNDLKYIYEQTGRPLWITEWNNGANWTNEWWPDSDRSYTPNNAQKQLNDLKGILQVLDTASFVERYFIYDWVQDCRAMVLNGELTLAGQYYAADKSQIAFNRKNEVIPHWNYQEPELGLRYFTLSNVMRLSWTDINGELSRGYKLEKKVNNGAYETIYTTDDVSVTFYLDPLNPEIGGSITYRLSLLTTEGEYLASNEVSYFQTAVEDPMQFGSFLVNNSDWNSTMFAEKYEEAPLILLGIPTFNNIFPLSLRVNNITTALFKFHFDPWDYLKDPVMTKTDAISAIALSPGSYDFGGLTAEGKVVPEVSREWVNVMFDTLFDTAPVIFCTIVSNSNGYPMTVAVQNVTTTGFEMCLKTEEAVTAILFPEMVNYIALEPGKGAIGQKRITVGRTEAGSGVTSTPLELGYDSTYSEPAFFGGLQSAADNFASTLRYYNSGDYTVNLMKQREFSGGISSVKEDILGWMVMDMARDQVIASAKQALAQQPGFYPNPVSNVIYFYFNQVTKIEIFDITGHKLLESDVLNSLDVSNLIKGIYILKAEGSSPVKFIKN